jgi:Na+-transporting methylmalonyl-CoA/oxaloacetate decarboxylase gamma subunit
MGSVVEMGFVKAVLLAIVVAISLIGGMARTAYADSGSRSAATAAFTGAGSSAQLDPSDPGLPPD